VAFTMVDRLLGGTGQSPGPNRALTLIEQNVVDSVVNLMLDNLTNRLQKVLKTLRGDGRLTETNIQEGLREIRIELNAAGGLPLVVADEIHVQQVILNLLRNAIEAMSHPQSAAARLITVETALCGPDEVSVRVVDQGPGIAEGDLERVFESFYSTKPGGLGVGLAICRKLMEAHGGALWAAHNPGGGAAFKFTLPVRAAGD